MVIKWTSVFENKYHDNVLFTRRLNGLPTGAEKCEQTPALCCYSPERHSLHYHGEYSLDNPAGIK